MQAPSSREGHHWLPPAHLLPRSSGPPTSLTARLHQRFLVLVLPLASFLARWATTPWNSWQACVCMCARVRTASSQPNLPATVSWGSLSWAPAPGRLSLEGEADGQEEAKTAIWGTTPRLLGEFSPSPAGATGCLCSQLVATALCDSVADTRRPCATSPAVLPHLCLSLSSACTWRLAHL